MPAPSRGGGPILADITIATHRHHLAGALDRPPDFKPNDAKASHPGAAVPVTAGDKTIGTFGSSAHGRALAMLRLDRVEDALAAGVPITAGGATLRLIKPDWARFAWPGEPKAAE